MIETVEGLADRGALTTLQQGLSQDRRQPVRVLHSRDGHGGDGRAAESIRIADREEIKERLGGNICRCTGYQKIFDAVEMARDVMNGALSPRALEQPPRNARRIPLSARMCAASMRRAKSPAP